MDRTRARGVSDRMIKTLAFAALALTTSTSISRADFAASTCTTPPNITGITGDGGCTGFVARDAKGREVNRVAQGYEISGSIHASPDGRSVVMIHGYPQSDDTFETKDALVFFRDGKEVAKYSMRDVITRMELTSESISHYGWLEGRPALVLGKTLKIATTSQRELEFDVATGKLLSSGDSALWKRCDVLVATGEKFAKPVNGLYTVQRAWLVKGKLPGGNGSKISFAVAKGVSLDRIGLGLCLEPDSRYGWMAVASTTTLWNRISTAP
jgi:hypothetical protein